MGLHKEKAELGEGDSGGINPEIMRKEFIMEDVTRLKRLIAQGGKTDAATVRYFIDKIMDYLEFNFDSDMSEDAVDAFIARSDEYVQLMVEYMELYQRMIDTA